jgi:hypothetical protein
MGKALPFGEIKLASLQLLVTSAELFFGALAFLDVDARSEPLRDIPVFVMERHFAMQKCVIRSVSTPNARFGFERLAACQSRTPFLNYSIDVVWMN